jgi:O-antigen ligase
MAKDLFTKEEFAISGLFIGYYVGGYIGIFTGISFLGKLVGILSIFILFKRSKGILENKEVIAAIYYSTWVIFACYLYGPRTNISSEKMFIYVYNIIIYSILYYNLFSHYADISFKNIGILILFWMILYLFFGYIFELKFSGISIFSPGSIRSISSFLKWSVSGGPHLLAFNYQQFGNYSVLAFIFVFINFINKKTNILLTSLVFVISLFFVAISGSRQSIVILLLALLSIYLIKPKKYILLNILTCSIVSIGIVFLVYAYNAGSSFIRDVFGAQDVFSAMNRDSVYKSAFQLIKEKPVLGFGLGGYHLPYTGLDFGEVRVYAHNIILELLTETGILGTLLYLFIWLFAYEKLLYGIKVKEIWQYKTELDQSFFPIIIIFLGRIMISGSIEASVNVFVLVAFYFSFLKNKIAYENKDIHAIFLNYPLHQK